MRITEQLQDPARRWLAGAWSPSSSTTDGRKPGAPVFVAATTYEFQAQFFESALLPRFLGLKHDGQDEAPRYLAEREDALNRCHACVLVDGSKVDRAQTTLAWDQLAVRLPAGAIQHAKVLLLHWEGLIRLVVASANLTRQGYRQRREVFAQLDFFNGPDSAPRSVLFAALDFLSTTAVWAEESNVRDSVERLRGSLAATRAAAVSWREMPAELGPNTYPRVEFAWGGPVRGARARTLMDAIDRAWSPHKADDVTVVSPFVGESLAGHRKLLARLSSLAKRTAGGHLVTRGAPATGADPKHTVFLPAHFEQAWREEWGQDHAFVYLPPVECTARRGDRDRKEAVRRDLHAKAILLENEHLDSLFIGSANFTPHGLGVGVRDPNLEAGLIFQATPNSDVGGWALYERLPVDDWDRDKKDWRRCTWQDDEALSEDEPPRAPVLPAAFAWAAYGPRTGILRVGLAEGCELPPWWELRKAEGGGEDEVVFGGAKGLERPAEGVLATRLPAGASLTGLLARWSAPGDALILTAIMAVQVESRDDLLPPDAVRRLSFEDLLNDLVAGREPGDRGGENGSGSVNGQEAPAFSPDARMIDPLRLVTTEGYLLYRARRFGKALAALERRVAATVHTRDALDYRLTRDPMGPVGLADALLRRFGISAEGSLPAAPPAGEGLFEAVFYLGELLLSVERIQRALRIDPEGPLARPFFEGKQRIQSMLERVRGASGALPVNLDTYLVAVREAARCQ